MSWMEKMIFGAMLLRAPEDDKGGGGGGNDKKDTPDPAKEMSDLKASNAALLARLDALEKKASPPQDDKKDNDNDLEVKARKEREAKEKGADDTKKLEAALRFSLGAKDWLKVNSSLLPKDTAGIFDAADKENYSSALEKDAAIKTSLIQLFFQQQSNLDLLTPGQKVSVEDWQKLTKNGKQDKAQHIYDSIFEPTFEMLKRIKKAEQLRQGGPIDQSDVEKSYRDRLVKGSRKHYLGEKENA